jgi:hypothetical protein
MATLAVPRSLNSFSNPTEAQFDTMRSAIISFLDEAGNLEASNLAAGTIPFSMLAMPGDDQALAWESSGPTAMWDNTATQFELTNPNGDIVFKLTASSTLEEAVRFRSSDGVLEVNGLLGIDNDVGREDQSIMWLLSRYRKPRLEYVDDNIVQAEVNLTSTTQSFIMLHDRLCLFADRTLSLAVGANGETTGDTGAAVSGLGAGVSRTANNWYFVYAVLVQFGDDNDGTKAILVANQTSPLAANIGTLNTAFGANKWVYMGVIRNGYNDGSATNVVVPFTYDAYGTLRFTQTTENNAPRGVRLATATASVDNLSYDVATGTGAAHIPATAVRAIFGGYRETHGFEFDYVSDATGETNQRTTTCYHTTNLTSMVAALYFEVVVNTGYNVVVRQGTAATNKRIMLAGLVDQFV